MQKHIPLNRINLLVDEIYWLHPDDVPHRGSIYRTAPRIMHQSNQVHVWGSSVPVAVPLARIEQQAKDDAAFFSKLRDAEPQSDLQWFIKHLASLKGQVVGDQVVMQYATSPLNSGSVQLFIESTGERKYYNVFRNLFLVWHIKRRAEDNGLVLVLALKDREGWNIATL
jgi:hypothetical protein